eukprot:SAG31_NODE_330_length_17593_cov_4.817891_3_plen_157_part_00
MVGYTVHTTNSAVATPIAAETKRALPARRVLMACPGFAFRRCFAILIALPVCVLRLIFALRWIAHMIRSKVAIHLYFKLSVDVDTVQKAPAFAGPDEREHALRTSYTRATGEQHKFRLEALPNVVRIGLAFSRQRFAAQEETDIPRWVTSVAVRDA